jgi:Trypsin-like peptidase domain
MATDDQNLYGRAQRTFGQLRVDEAVAKVRAIVGLPKVPDSEKAAQAALDKLRSGRERPTPTELAALEFVIRMMRPAPLSIRGRLQALPAERGSSVYQPQVSAAWDRFCTNSAPILYSVGRLDRTAGSNPHIGTGFLVAPDLVLTNHHVVSALSHGADELDSGMAVIRFYQEYDGPEPVPACPILKVVAIHPALDMALLQVQVPDKRPVLQFDAGALPAHLMVGTLGYPYKDDRNPLFVDAIYQDRYGVKRGAVGELIAARGDLIFHDCSTLGGNSGSPVMALETGAVVGLHFTGEFMYRNGAVSAAAAAEFVADATRTP